jgi:hypothetical protein
MSHQFLIMWCNEGLECCIDITEDQQQRMWERLKGQPLRETAIPNYNHLLLRARVNSQRHYEVYTCEATDGITAEDIKKCLKPARNQRLTQFDAWDTVCTVTEPQRTGC